MCKLLMSVLVHCHLFVRLQNQKIITVDGEEILLRIADIAGKDRFRTLDSYTYYCAEVSWSFACYIKDIQRI